MDQFFSEDSLSAYFDGEVTPEERARIEGRLSSQPELQRELEEIRRVSELVQNLKGEPAPAEFRAAVMQQIEREMLLGPPSAPAPAGSLPWRRARWIYGGGAFAAAATLLIAVAYYAGQPAGPNRPEGAAIALNDRTTLPSESASPRSGVRFDRESAEKTASKEEVASTGSSRGAADSPGEPTSAPLPPAAAAGTVDHPAGVARLLGANRQSQLVFSKDELREAEIGDVVKALEHDEGKVSVVYLTVVDRTEGLQGFQRALARNSILQQPKEPAEFDKAADSQAGDANDFSERVRSHKAGDLECVYVDAPGEKLAAALQELRAEMQISELRVEEPVTLAELDDRSGNRLLAGRSFGDAESAPAREKADSRKRMPAEPSGEKSKENKDAKVADSQAKKPSLARNAPADAPAKNESAEPADKDRDAGFKTARQSEQSGDAFFDKSNAARQVQVTLPRGALGSSQSVGFAVDGIADRKAGEQPQSAARAPVVAVRPRSASPSLAGSEFGVAGKESEDLAKQRVGVSMQVLFVLIDRKSGLPLPSAAPPAAPAKKARGNAPRDKHDDGAAS